MSFPERHMRDTATWWKRKPGEYDRQGRPQYESPVSIKCRWENRNELFRDDQGNERVSMSVIYPDRTLSNGDYIKYGVSTTSNPLDAGAALIEGYSEIQNLFNTNRVRKARLTDDGAS